MAARLKTPLLPLVVIEAIPVGAFFVPANSAIAGQKVSLYLRTLSGAVCVTDAFADQGSNQTGTYDPSAPVTPVDSAEITYCV